MKRKLIFVSALFAFAMTLAPLKVSAVQSPVGCNSNRLNLAIGKDRTTVQQGDVITYTIIASNLDAPPLIACDIDTATITVRLPAADGTPTGTLVTLGSNLAFPAGTPITVMGTASYTVAVNTGVTDIVAEVQVNGVLHDAPVDHAAEITKTIGTAVLEATPPSGGSGGSSGAPGLPNAGAFLE